MVGLVWIIIAVVVVGIGTLLGLADRRARRKGHLIRRASTMSAIASSRRTNVRRRRPRVGPTAPPTGNKYPKL